ncbi:SGNH/GDSL hydrolase family protein [Salinarimonas ramus]|uniref:Lysophospholipase L1 n=1 Tax=Salinarimonas ramus TaxID=690164 RepID=A0A917QDX6_9HYPH|nr:SGNH/GDSL hydrolase family protein [Salinarimonas ramus]GGK45916.1 hypothetical protein GCM10011322_36300 [Salinarimonas ramus]
MVLSRLFRAGAAEGRPSRGASRARTGAGPLAILALAATLIAPLAPWTTPALASSCAEVTAVTRADTLPRLPAAGGFRVLAIGSSSTFGTGASAPSLTYPARLEALLRARIAREDVVVVNAGIPGETADATLDRFARLLAQERFDLAIWQVGTNDALRGVAPDEFAARLERGVALARDGRVPLLVVDPQYFPGIPDRVAYERTVRLVGDLAEARGVAVLRRYDVMRAWADRSEAHLASMLSGDRFHMGDAGYACLADLIADALVGADGRTAFAE